MTGEVMQATVIDDIIDINKLIIKADQILCRVDVENKTGLIIPDSVKDSTITRVSWVIIKVGDAVKEYKPGMVLVDFVESAVDLLNHNGDGYGIIGQYSVKLATTADNIQKK